MTARTTNHYVVGISLGPVGGFIGAGRRSRDLWYGSRWVAEVTRFVTKNLVVLFAERLELVMPLPDRIGKSFLESHKGPTISNHIVAHVHETNEQEITNALTQLRSAVHAFVADEIKNLAQDSRFRDIASADILRQQADAIRAGDFIEFYAAAALLDSSAGDRAEALARAEVHQRIDGLKQIRSYLIPSSEPGRPKSSMDAGWDSVLFETSGKDDWKRLEFLRAKRGIRHEERLDAIGLLRRRALFDDADAELPVLPFPPLARVTVDPWIEGVSRGSPQVMHRIALTLDRKRRTHADALTLVTSPCREPGKDLDTIPTIFGYDPSLFFEGGLEALQRSLEQMAKGKRRMQALGPTPTPRLSTNLGDIGDAIRGANDLLGQIRGDVGVLHRDYGAPNAYYALIEADGDGIGAVIQGSEGWNLTSLLDKLYEFADKSWGVVERHGGAAFYIGGDELAAYLPLDKAFGSIRELAKLFDDLVGKTACESGILPENQPSLSFGMVVAHVKDDLRSVRRRVRDALRDAKNERRTKKTGRGYLEIVESVRGASDRHFSGPVELLAKDIETWCTSLQTNREFSLTMVQAWRELLHQGFSGEQLIALVHADLIERAKRAERAVDENLKRRLQACGIAPEEQVEQLIHEILFASRLAEVKAQRDPQRTTKETV